MKKDNNAKVGEIVAGNYYCCFGQPWWNAKRLHCCMPNIIIKNPMQIQVPSE